MAQDVYTKLAEKKRKSLKRKYTSRNRSRTNEDSSDSIKKEKMKKKKSKDHSDDEESDGDHNLKKIKRKSKKESNHEKSTKRKYQSSEETESLSNHVSRKKKKRSLSKPKSKTQHYKKERIYAKMSDQKKSKRKRKSSDSDQTISDKAEMEHSLKKTFKSDHEEPQKVENSPCVEKYYYLVSQTKSSEQKTDSISFSDSPPTEKLLSHEGGITDINKSHFNLQQNQSPTKLSVNTQNENGQINHQEELVNSPPEVDFWKGRHKRLSSCRSPSVSPAKPIVLFGDEVEETWKSEPC